MVNGDVRIGCGGDKKEGTRLIKQLNKRAQTVLKRDYDRPQCGSDNAEDVRERNMNVWLNKDTIVALDDDEEKVPFQSKLPLYASFASHEL